MGNGFQDSVASME